MSETKTPVPETQTPIRPGPDGPKKGPATHEEKQKRRKLIRRTVAGVVAAAVVLTSVWALRKFVFKEEDVLGQPMTAMVMTDSIRSVVDGTGTARAKNAAVITPEADAMVLDVYVAEGDMVEEGQQLYDMDDAVARQALQKAQESLDDTLTTLNKHQEELANLTIRAPHPGKLMEVNADLRAGRDAAAGEAVATLVNDTRLRLSLYYSWAYEGMIAPGQAASISIPALMTELPGTVEKVNYVRRVVPEGSVTFEVVFLLDNPGTLTEGTLASAVMTAADGSPIYPYEAGKLTYLETTKLTIPSNGPVEWAELMNYADVTAGQALVTLGDKDVSAAIAADREILREKEKAVDEAQARLDTCHAVAPIAGRVLSCPLIPGSPVASGQVVQIADTSTMLVDINIDERHVGFVTPGMMVELQDQMGNYYMGSIEQVSLTAKSENGVAVFPGTVLVDNPDGTLFTGTYIQYKFVASQSDNCLVVPVQAVIKVTLPDPAMGEPDAMGDEMSEADGMAEGSEDTAVPDMGMDGMMGGGMMGGGMGFGDSSAATVCFVMGEPDGRAIEADPAWNMPEGFYAVVVTTGLSDDTNVEITSGLNEGDEVFTGYITNQADTWG